MAINATVKQNQAIQATVQATGQIIPVRAALGASISLEELTDVTPTAKENGATVVYSESNGLYEVKKLNMDGGTF